MKCFVQQCKQEATLRVTPIPVEGFEGNGPVKKGKDTCAEHTAKLMGQYHAEGYGSFTFLDLR